MDQIEDKSGTIGILGLGYVGLPLAIRFLEENHKVIGFDIDPEKIEKLNAGKTYIAHIPDSEIEKMNQKEFQVTTDFSQAAHCLALIICVPTPLDSYREPDLSYVINTAEMIAPHIQKGQIVSLESTTYPGTTDEQLMPIFAEKGFTVGEDLFLIYSPEREDPGNENFTTRTIPKVVGGLSRRCLELGSSLYSSIIDRVVPVSSTKAAEMTKLLENIHRAVNIGLVNEMKIVADKMGIDIYEVIRAAASKPFGFTPYYPGPGLGGHCIPIDPFYLTWKAREFGINTRFIELAGEVNQNMPHFVLGKVFEALNSAGKAVKGSEILVLGVAYKKNIDDMRESPSVEIMDLLNKQGAQVSYSDPFVPVFKKMRKYNFDLNSMDVTPEALNSHDAVIIATNHDSFDYQMILEHSKVIIDTRGVFPRGTPKVTSA